MIDPLATRSLTVDQDGQRLDPLRRALDIADDLIAQGRREEANELVEEWILPVLERRAGTRRV